MTGQFRVKRSKSPAYVIMRDIRTGQPVRIPVGAIPKIFWPETWYENPYWMYSGALSKADIAEFFSEKKEIRIDFAQKLATYIYNYCSNMAAVTWLMIPDKDEYLKAMKPLMEKLAAMKARAKNRKDIQDMIRMCLKHGLDPF